MKLKIEQVRLIEQELRVRGLVHQQLQEDVLDHICSSIEDKMEHGSSFMDAYHDVISQFAPTGFERIQEETVQNLKNITMIKSYLMVGLRNLMHQRAFSIINIFGLTLGFVCVVLIYLFVNYEMSYDQFHSKKDRIYRLVTNRAADNGNISHTAYTGAPWAEALKSDYPEVQEIVRFMKYRLSVMINYTDGDKKFFEDHLMWADASVFRVFDFPLIIGDPATALKDPNSVVISRRVANKYFGSVDPIGKILTYEGEHKLTITGVMEDLPQNGHFYADFFGSFNTLGGAFWDIVDNWTILYYYTYLLLPDGYQPVDFEEQLPGFYNKYLGENARNYTGELQPLDQIYLKSDRSGELKANASMDLLYLLSAIAFFILLLGISNFVNLTTAKSITRAKEVGVRKVMGGLKSDLFLQFIIEAVVLVFVALIIALLVVYSMLPAYQEFTERPFSLFSEHWILEVIALMVFTLAVGLLAGLYPSFVLSKMGTTMALKGSFKTDKIAIFLREGLVVFQFVICIALITATLQVKDQLSYIKNKNLGFDKEEILLLPFISTGPVSPQQLATIKYQMEAIPGVSNVSITSHRLAGDQAYGARYIFRLPQHPADTFLMGRLHIDPEFIPTYGIKLLAGRNYQKSFGTDSSAFIINQEVIKKLGLKDPEAALGIQIGYETQNANGRYFRTGKVIGVVENFNFKSLHHAIDPMVMDIQPDRSHFIACKLGSGAIFDALPLIEEKWPELWPLVPFEYSFLNNLLVELYQSENTLSKLFQVFTALSILIACLGLIGLASYATSLRIKEIGIRKVLGASIPNVLTLMLKSFVLLCVIGAFIGSPISYYFLQNWLEGFVYRVPVDWFNFIVAGMLVLLLTILSVGYITVKAATKNPVKTLRFE